MVAMRSCGHQLVGHLGLFDISHGHSVSLHLFKKNSTYVVSTMVLCYIFRGDMLIAIDVFTSPYSRARQKELAHSFNRKARTFAYGVASAFSRWNGVDSPLLPLTASL